MIYQKTSKGSDVDEHILSKISLFGHSTFLLKAFFLRYMKKFWPFLVAGSEHLSAVFLKFYGLSSVQVLSSYSLQNSFPHYTFRVVYFIFLWLQKNKLAQAFFLSFSFQSLFFFHRQWQFMGQHCKWKDKHFLDKNHNIFQTTRFNQTMIFSKLID